MSTLNVTKTERIDVRASTPVKQLLQEAARASDKNVSEFLLMPASRQPPRPWQTVAISPWTSPSGRHSRQHWIAPPKASPD